MLEAQEHGRRRTARELHDNVANSSRWQSFSWPKSRPRSPRRSPNRQARQAIVCDLNRHSEGFARTLSILAPGPWNYTRPQSLSREISADYGFEIVFISAGNNLSTSRAGCYPLPDCSGSSAECCQNSGARHVQMELRRAGAGLMLRVRDDGVDLISRNKQPPALVWTVCGSAYGGRSDRKFVRVSLTTTVLCQLSSDGTLFVRNNCGQPSALTDC